MDGNEIAFGRVAGRVDMKIEVTEGYNGKK